MIFIVGTAVLVLTAVWVSGSGLTAFHAAALVGYSCFVPMVCDFRFPSTHCKNLHVLRPLSNSKLPVLCRSLIPILPLSRARLATAS
jgi:hypothetical protein